MMTDQCKICRVERGQHQIAEDNRTTHHKFSENGQLVQIDSTGQKSQAQPRMVIANAVDVQLRQLLIAKGVLTNADFSPAANPGTSTAGDSSAGEPPSSG